MTEAPAAAPHHPHALLTPAEMGRADALTIAGGVPGMELMEAAGLAVADAAQSLGEGRVVVLCGPGNNGGDGYVAARILAERGRQVVMAALGDPARLSGDAAEAFRRYRAAAPEVISAEGIAFVSDDIIVDALFGAGLDRPLADAAAALVARVNASGARVLAVDLPSGINGATGALMGAAVRATKTVTFFRGKPGHWLYPGREHCGATEVAQIGIDAACIETIDPRQWLNHPALWRAGLNAPADAHKYQHGHVAVIGGLGVGAARLAARAALRAGAGLVTLFVPEAALAAHLARGPDALMVRAFGNDEALLDQLADPRFSVLVAGPAFGTGVAERQRLQQLLSLKRKVVLDADALTLFANEADALSAQLDGSSAVLTPHAGEFHRLFGARDGDRLTRARAAASALAQVMVLKGADTVIAAPDGRAIINANAPPWLATAGSGDVLSGLVATMLARGLAPFEAASAAVWLHGAAGQVAGEGLIADDLPEALRGVWPQLKPPRTTAP